MLSVGGGGGGGDGRVEAHMGALSPDNVSPFVKLPRATMGIHGDWSVNDGACCLLQGCNKKLLSKEIIYYMYH